MTRPPVADPHHPFVNITHGTVVTESDAIEGGAVLIAHGRIVYVGSLSDVPPSIRTTNGWINRDQFHLFDAQGGWICPGMIDLHIHGGGGADTMDGSVQAIRTIARTHAAHGTTAMLATTMTEDYAKIVAASKAVKQVADNWDPSQGHGARVLGLHLEGPYINEKRLGAQNPRYVRPIDLDELAEIAEVLGDAFRLITLAPELPHGLEAIRFLQEMGVVVSMGHTDASFEEARQAMRAGARHVTHMYNAMTPLHHRDPGVVGAALLAPEVLCEIIADGIHLHPAATRLVWEQKGAQGICLVTDAIAAAGMPEGEYALGGLPVTVKDGACRLADGRLAGSILTMDRAVGHMVTEVGVPVTQAIRMASLNPAREIGLDQQKGSLAVGKDADVTILDADFHAVATWVEGHRF